VPLLAIHTGLVDEKAMPQKLTRLESARRATPGMSETRFTRRYCWEIWALAALVRNRAKQQRTGDTVKDEDRNLLFIGNYSFEAIFGTDGCKGEIRKGARRGRKE
jgi:hypothetical protein